MTAKIEVENLMIELFDFAKKMLKQYGEFHPFGGYLDANKQVVHIGVDMMISADSTGNDRLDLLVDTFKSTLKIHTAVAFGLVTNVTLQKDGGEKQDAIKLFLEHQEGYCVEVFFEYTVLSNKTVEIIAKFAQAGEAVFFKHRTENKWGRK